MSHVANCLIFLLKNIFHFKSYIIFHKEAIINSLLNVINFWFNKAIFFTIFKVYKVMTVAVSNLWSHNNILTLVKGLMFYFWELISIFKYTIDKIRLIHLLSKSSHEQPNYTKQSICALYFSAEPYYCDVVPSVGYLINLNYNGSINHFPLVNLLVVHQLYFNHNLWFTN